MSIVSSAVPSGLSKIHLLVNYIWKGTEKTQIPSGQCTPFVGLKFVINDLSGEVIQHVNLSKLSNLNLGGSE